MRSLRKKQDLKALQKEWDEILAATGFQDIERTIDGERALIQYASYPYRRATDSNVRENKLSYYAQISSMIHDEKFPNEIERLIMTRIGDGAQIQEIVMEIRKSGQNIHRQTVRYIIRRYENKWGIKSWTQKQMYLKTHST